MKPTRRDVLVLGGGMVAGGALSTWVSPERHAARRAGVTGGPVSAVDEEYVWISANAHLGLFKSRDHPALEQAGKDLGVRVTIAGPNTVDIPAFVAEVERTAVRKPAGMMIVGWDPSALIPCINKAVDKGIPVVCVDADVPESKRLAFIGTDWTEIGIRQGEAMVKALQGRRGKVALLGLIEQFIDQQAFAGFRSVAEKAGLTVLEPFQDKGNVVEATRVAAGIIQAYSDLVGLAGFDSESGPGMGQAVKEAGKIGKIIVTSVETMDQHLQMLKEGILTACIGQKRELFTYFGVKALYDYVHSTLRLNTGISPIPVNYNTGTFTVTRENVDAFLVKKG